jgi:LPS sulfotransferase NodH
MRVVLLSRDNDVKRTISIIRARALNAETGRWNRRSGVTVVEPTVVDPQEFATKLANNRARKEALVSYATSLGLPLLRIDYRDLMLDPPTTVARVFEHIGVAPRAVAGSTLKNTSDDLRESVANFDELRAEYAGTEYEPMFDEVSAP